jgi:hypothetical protein
MMPREITDQLERLLSNEDFATSSAELIDHWTSIEVGYEAVEQVLRFIEEHPSVEFGTPGALVHFVERFYGHGYEEMLLESVSRKPTRYTVWMLNRVINGAKSSVERQRFVDAMIRAKSHPRVDLNALNQINHFLKRLGIR